MAACDQSISALRTCHLWLSAIRNCDAQNDETGVAQTEVLGRLEAEEQRSRSAPVVQDTMAAAVGTVRAAAGSSFSKGGGHWADALSQQQRAVAVPRTLRRLRSAVTSDAVPWSAKSKPGLSLDTSAAKRNGVFWLGFRLGGPARACTDRCISATVSRAGSASVPVLAGAHPAAQRHLLQSWQHGEELPTGGHVPGSRNGSQQQEEHMRALIELGFSRPRPRVPAAVSWPRRSEQVDRACRCARAGPNGAACSVGSSRSGG